MTRTASRSHAARILALAGVAAILGACTQGKDYQRPEIQTPGTFRTPAGTPVSMTEAASLADQPWWQLFNDPVLQQLIDKALANNLDVAIAAARVDQARAMVGVARSEGMPQVGYQFGGGGTQSFVPLPDAPTDFRYGGVAGGLSAAWEIDVWGRIKRSTEAARARLMADEEVRRGVLLSLVSNVAAAYFELLALDQQLAIAEESARVYKGYVDFFSLRFEAGRDTRLPVERSEANYAESLDRIAEVKRRIAVQENLISILTGDYPQGVPRGRNLAEQALPKTPAGATTALLQRRPDIRRAEQEIVNANAQVGVAAANFFPRIGLNAFVSGQSLNFSTGVDASFALWNVAGSLAGPIFSGGKLRAEKANREAFLQEKIADYRKTILGAFQETSDALTAQAALVDRQRALSNRVAALERSVELARARYDGGRASYFEVLEAEQLRFPAENELVKIRRDQLLATVDLYRALGGGWQLGDNWASPAAQGR